MIGKIFKLIIFFSFTMLIGIAFAGNEDWQGAFLVKNPQGQQATITHSPDKVVSVFPPAVNFTATNTFTFDKSVNINDFHPSDKGTLGVNMRADDFTGQVKKWGPIENQKITLGPTYPSELAH